MDHWIIGLVEYWSFAVLHQSNNPILQPSITSEFTPKFQDFSLVLVAEGPFAFRGGAGGYWPCLCANGDCCFWRRRSILATSFCRLVVPRIASVFAYFKLKILNCQFSI
ncbi:MAG: hypothetical protein ACRENG_28180 [bacterium]